MEPSRATPLEQSAAMEAAGAAWSRSSQRFAQSDLDLHIAEKEDGSLVSDADMASQQVIQSILQATRIPVLSEEAAAPTYDERKHWERYCGGSLGRHRVVFEKPFRFCSEYRAL